MANLTTEQALELARAETRTLSDQLRQARAELHRMGIADQNRALVCAAVAGGVAPNTRSLTAMYTDCAAVRAPWVRS